MKIWRGLQDKRQCEGVRPLLSSYIDGRATADEARLLEQHLANCADCQIELEQLRLVVQGLRALPKARPSRSFALSAVPARAIPSPGPNNIIYLRRLAVTLAASLVMLFGLSLQVGGAYPGLFLANGSVSGAPAKTAPADTARSLPKLQEAQPVPLAPAPARAPAATAAPAAQASKAVEGVAASPEAPSAQAVAPTGAPAPAAVPAPLPAAAPLAAPTAEAAAAAPGPTVPGAGSAPAVPPAAGAQAPLPASPMAVSTRDAAVQGAAPAEEAISSNVAQQRSAAAESGTTERQAVPAVGVREGIWAGELALMLGLLLVGVGAFLGRRDARR